MRTFTEVFEQEIFPYSGYVRQEGFDVFYIRIGDHPRLNRWDFVLSNIVVATPGLGFMTRFLDHWEYTQGKRVMVESVINTRFKAYLRRRGYIQMTSDEELFPNYASPRCHFFGYGYGESVTQKVGSGV
jgi:hypothetical protein